MLDSLSDFDLLPVSFRSGRADSAFFRAGFFRAASQFSGAPPKDANPLSALKLTEISEQAVFGPCRLRSSLVVHIVVCASLRPHPVGEAVENLKASAKSDA